MHWNCAGPASESANANLQPWMTDRPCGCALIAPARAGGCLPVSQGRRPGPLPPSACIEARQCQAPRLVFLRQFQQPPGVPLINLFAVSRRDRYGFNGTNRLADEHGAFFGVEWHVGSKQHPIHSKKRQAALEGRRGPADCRVAIEHAKVIERPPLELMRYQLLVFLRGSRTQLIQAGPDSAFEIGGN